MTRAASDTEGINLPEWHVPGTLTTELRTDPNKLGFAPLLDAGDYEAAANLLNAPRYQQQAAEIDAREMRVWVAQNGRSEALRKARDNGNAFLGRLVAAAEVDQYRAYADTAYNQIMYSDLPTRLNGSGVQAMIAALVSKKILSQDDAAALYALGMTMVSRMFQLAQVDESLPASATPDMVQANA